MKSRFILFRRAGVFYAEETATGKQTSLRTKDEAEALTLLNVKNEATRQPATLARLLGQHTERRSPSDLVWDFSRATGYRLVKDCMERAGIAGGMACPKGLRHGMAVACVTRNIPLPTIQKWLGHARLETTAVYLQVGGGKNVHSLVAFGSNLVKSRSGKFRSRFRRSRRGPKQQNPSGDQRILRLSHLITRCKLLCITRWVASANRKIHL